MRVRDFECRSYGAAERLIGEAYFKKVTHNTCLDRYDLEGVLWLALHGHKIVEFHPRGRVLVWSHGFRTATTKDRINRCLPPGLKVYQRKGAWFLWLLGTTKVILFEEGMDVVQAKRDMERKDGD